MKISIQSLLEGARNASGAVAVIDTFRAFTTAAVALANGASRIIMVETVEEALALRAAKRGAILHGRSPGAGAGLLRLRELAVRNLGGKTIIQPRVPGRRASSPRAPKPAAFMRPPW